VCLFLLATPPGGRLWRFKYRIDGKEKLLAIGKYPDVSLADARKARDRAKELLSEGRDPSVAKQLNRFEIRRQAEDTFEKVAREWHQVNEARWVEVHSNDVIRSLERDVFPKIGALPIAEIDAPTVFELLRGVEKRGTGETARRIRQRIAAVHTFAIASGRAENNPAALVVGAMAPMIKGRQPAITDLEEARQIIRDVDATSGHAVTKLAIRLLALTAVRPGVICSTPGMELPQGETLTANLGRTAFGAHGILRGSRDSGRLGAPELCEE